MRYVRFLYFSMHKPEPKTSSPWARLKLVGAGILLGCMGIALMLRGVQVVRNWTGQPMFSWGFIAAGILCLLLAGIPVSWIAWAAQTKGHAKRYGNTEGRNHSER
jgi:mannose/fructose/N-acetylgalactosamine-specific phosphotransferase system component IIC